MHRRTFVSMAGALVASRAAAQGQPAAFPTKPLRIVVPNAPGGGADLTARTVGEAMARGLKQPVVVDNRPGAGGVIAGQAALQAPADGHTLLLISSGTAVSAALFKALPFDTRKDFTPVGLLASFDLVIVGAESGRFKTLADVLAYAKANPGKLNIGTPNIGTTQHLAAELFKSAAGIDAQVVPFKGTPDVIGALRGGQIDVGLDILGPLLTQIQGGSLRPLAVTGARRSRVLPQVPTAREAGVAGLLAASWNGLAVRSGTPPAVVARLSAELATALKNPEVRKKLEALNLEPTAGTAEEAAALLRSDIQRWTQVIDRAGVPRL